MTDITERLRQSQHSHLSQSCAVEAADTIETLRQRVRHLENTMAAAGAVNEYRHELICKLDAELTALKQQHEPFGWYWSSTYEDGIILNDGKDYDIQAEWIPLYAAPLLCRLKLERE